MNEGYRCGTSMLPMCYSGREVVTKPAVNCLDAEARRLGVGVQQIIVGK